MTTTEALETLDRAAAMAPLTRAQHEAALRALHTLHEALQNAGAPQDPASTPVGEAQDVGVN